MKVERCGDRWIDRDINGKAVSVGHYLRCVFGSFSKKMRVISQESLFQRLVRVGVGRTIMQTAIELFAPGFVPLRGRVAVAYVLHNSYI